MVEHSAGQAGADKMHQERLEKNQANQTRQRYKARGSALAACKRLNASIASNPVLLALGLGRMR